MEEFGVKRLIECFNDIYESGYLLNDFFNLVKFL